MARPREPWRREQLLDAAVAAASVSGLGSLTIKEVAQTAGVSTGTIHYHFDDIEGVMLGIVERSLEQMYDQRLAAIADIPSISDKLSTLIDLGIPDELSHEVALMYEAIPVIRSREHFDSVIRSYVERQVSLYRSVIDAGVSTGIFTPQEPVDVIARNLLALEDAYDLYRVVGATRDGSIGRRNLRVYASRALGTQIGTD
jgi:AcrR family transcriptional regulator